jgi:hypothetical protein
MQSLDVSASMHHAMSAADAAPIANPPRPQPLHPEWIPRCPDLAKVV